MNEDLSNVMNQFSNILKEKNIDINQILNKVSDNPSNSSSNSNTNTSDNQNSFTSNITGESDFNLDIKEWLSLNLEAYLEDGNLNAFVRSLEYVVRAKDNISNLSKKTGISRSNLYAIFKGEVTPQFDTVLKVLKELGYTLKVA